MRKRQMPHELREERELESGVSGQYPIEKREIDENHKKTHSHVGWREEHATCTVGQVISGGKISQPSVQLVHAATH